MAAWTDDPATITTHIRAVHINELRRVVSFYRQQAGLPPINWSDGTIGTSTHIRAVHFTELRSAIQDLWTHDGLGTLPNWSVGSDPSVNRQISARDINDLRSWVNTADPPLNIWTGFHFCNPLDNINQAGNTGMTSNQVAAFLLADSERWATVILCPPSNGLDGGWSDALDHAASTISGLGGPQLGQCIARIYSPSQPTFTDDQSAVSWIQPYLANLDYFLALGGANVVLFNELNMSGEPQQNIDPRTLALIAAAIRDNYTDHYGTRQLYILFPGPGGGALTSASLWNGYWDTYDLRDTTTHQYQEFQAYYGSDVDARLQGHTMLYHGGTGIFDRVALHCYGPDPTTFATDDPSVNPALQVIQWYLNPLSGSGAAPVDTTGWCYVTESGGQCVSQGSSCYGDSTDAGAALADFEVHASNRHAVGNTYGNPPLLQAVYGYILDYSNSGATSNGQHEIGNVSGSSPTSAYLDGYAMARSFP